MNRALLLALVVSCFSLSAWAQQDNLPVSDLESSLSDVALVVEPLKNKNNRLYEVLAQAYENNPSVRAARAELLAVQEQLDQAQAGFKPSVAADLDVTHTDTEVEGSSFVAQDGGNTSKTASLNLQQPLYRGGRTQAEINQAKNIIAAQEFALSGVEQNILYTAAVTYMDVLRDEAVLTLNENNRELLSHEKERAENRFLVGELTRTDVSQSHARLAAAEANVITAKGQLKRSKAVFQQITGTLPPPDMGYPEKQVELPGTLEEALALADSNNREVLQSQFIKQAAEYNVDSQKGALLPEISAIGQLNKSYDPSSLIDEQRQASVGVNASIPLYQAGADRSRIRQAKKIANQRSIQIVEAKEKAKQETVESWEALQAAQAEVKARELQIEAARIAREGVDYETKLGERTTLDALNANQELLDAQVSLIEAKRNEVVARFALARTLGILVPQKLGFSSITP